jgi:hypothetical protein
LTCDDHYQQHYGVRAQAWKHVAGYRRGGAGKWRSRVRQYYAARSAATLCAASLASANRLELCAGPRPGMAGRSQTRRRGSKDAP